MTRRPELPRYSYPYKASALIMRTIKVSCSSVAFQKLLFAMQCYLARAAMKKPSLDVQVQSCSRCYASNNYPKQLHDYELQHSKGARRLAEHAGSVMTRASEDPEWQTDLGRDA